MNVAQKDCWLQLVFQQYKGQKMHCHEHLRKPKDLERALRNLRKQYLGSDLSLEDFVCTEHGPDNNAIEELTSYLAKQAAVLMQMDHPNNTECEETFFYPFFWYSLHMFAGGQVGYPTFDDIILLAETYQNSLGAFEIVMEEDLPKDLVDEFRAWVMENNIVPVGFSDAVQAAIAVLLGVMPDPKEDHITTSRRRLRFAPQPVSMNTLHNYVVENGPCHVWVRKNVFGPVFPALVSNHEHGLVAIWRAGSKSEWLREKDYGKSWFAYLEKPHGR